MTQKEEALKKRLIDFIFDYDYSLSEISNRLGMTKTAMNLYLFHGYSVTAEQTKVINNFLTTLGY